MTNHTMHKHFEFTGKFKCSMFGDSRADAKARLKALFAYTGIDGFTLDDEEVKEEA